MQYTHQMGRGLDRKDRLQLQINFVTVLLYFSVNLPVCLSVCLHVLLSFAYFYLAVWLYFSAYACLSTTTDHINADRFFRTLTSFVLVYSPYWNKITLLSLNTNRRRRLVTRVGESGGELVDEFAAADFHLDRSTTPRLVVVDVQRPGHLWSSQLAATTSGCGIFGAVPILLLTVCLVGEVFCWHCRRTAVLFLVSLPCVQLHNCTKYWPIFRIL